MRAEVGRVDRPGAEARCVEAHERQVGLATPGGRGREHPVGVGRRERERLLQQQVLPRLRRGHREGDLDVGRDGDRDRVARGEDRVEVGAAGHVELGAGGLPEDRMLLVQGLASSVPFDVADPRSPANRRISILVMNRDAEDRLLRVKTEDAEEPAEAAAGPPKDGVTLPSIPTVIAR